MAFKKALLYAVFVAIFVLSFSPNRLIADAHASDVTFKPASFAEGSKEVETVPGILKKPEGAGPFPAIVLLHGKGGMKSHTAQSWPRYLNGLGYVTLSVDSLSSRGSRRSDWTILDQTLDAYGALDYLATLPFVESERIGVIGFSAGGRVVNRFIHGVRIESDSGRLFKAAVSFYGHCKLIRFEKKTLPLMMLVGEYETAKRLKDCLIDHPGTEVELHILKGAYHSFDDERFTSLRESGGGNLMQYNHSARIESEEFVKIFLAKNL